MTLRELLRSGQLSGNEYSEAVSQLYVNERRVGLHYVAAYFDAKGKFLWQELRFKPFIAEIAP